MLNYKFYQKCVIASKKMSTNYTRILSHFPKNVLTLFPLSAFPFLAFNFDEIYARCAFHVNRLSFVAGTCGTSSQRDCSCASNKLNLVYAHLPFNKRPQCGARCYRCHCHCHCHIHSHSHSHSQS